MSRLVRWLVAGTASVVTFVLCVWLVRAVPFGWLPPAEDDRWVVALAFGGVAAAAVAGAVNWWAGQGTTPPTESPRRQVRQRAKATSGAQVDLAGRDLRSGGGGTADGEEVSEEIVQRAKGSRNARITLAGRDQDTRGQQ